MSSFKFFFFVCITLNVMVFCATHSEGGDSTKDKSALLAEPADLRTIKNAQWSVVRLIAVLDGIKKTNENMNKLGDQVFIDRVRDADKSLRKVGCLLASIIGIVNTDAKIPAVQNVGELEQKTTENKNYLTDEDLKTFENMFKPVVSHLNNLKESDSFMQKLYRAEERPNAAVKSDGRYIYIEQLINEVQEKLELAKDATERIIHKIVNLSSKLQEVIGEFSSL